MAEWRHAPEGWLGLPFMALAVWVAFSPTLATPFVQDDFWFLARAIGPADAETLFLGALPDLVRPLPTAWVPRLMVALFGIDPHPYHAFLLLVVVATTVFFADALLRVTGSRFAALAGASLYGVSAVHPYTTGWIAGGVDIFAAFFLILALRTAARYLQGSSTIWPIAPFLVLGLLSKELIAPSALCVAGLGWVAENKEKFDSRRKVRLAQVAASGIAAFVVWWILANQLVRNGGPDLQWAPMRIVEVLVDSAAVCAPWFDQDAHSLAWLLWPTVLCLIAVRKSPRLTLWAVCLWVGPACLFGISPLPVALQPYYGHFPLMGLSLLFAMAVESLGAKMARQTWSWLFPISLVALTSWSVAERRATIERHHTPALFLSVFSSHAKEDIELLLQDHPRPEVLLLDVPSRVWWAMGQGDIFPVHFPGTRAEFDGFDGHRARSDMKTDLHRLVIRHEGKGHFEIVE